MSTHSTLLKQAPPAPTFTRLLDSVYFLTSGGYVVSANSGGGDTADDAIQTKFRYSLINDSLIGTLEMFNVFTNSSGQLALQTVNGNFITAVGGGGRTTNVLHTDAVSVAAWEEFRIAKTGAVGAFSVSIQTSSNNFLTAVGAGGQTTNAIHSDAKAVNAWETFFVRQALGPSAAYAQYFIVDTKKNQALAARSGGGQTQNTIEFLSANSNFPQAWARFTIVPLGNGEFALRTANDNFVTAVNGGGLNTGTAASDNIHTDATAVSTWERFRFVPSNAGSFIIQTASGNFLGERTVGGSAEGEYSTNINSDSGSPTMFWLIPTTFF